MYGDMFKGIAALAMIGILAIGVLFLAAVASGIATAIWAWNHVSVTTQ